MYRRYTDISQIPLARKDFIIRKHVPPGTLISAVFFFGFIALTFLAAYNFHMGDFRLFIAASGFLLGSLFAFTFYFIRRTHKLLTLTEFQNALFSAAAASKNSFFFIVSRMDGSVIYYSNNYGKIFNKIRPGGIYTLDELLECGKIAGRESAEIKHAMEKGTAVSIHFPLYDGNNIVTNYTLNASPITRPSGFYLISANDMVGSAEAAASIKAQTLEAPKPAVIKEASSPRSDSDSIIFGKIIDSVPAGIIVSNADGSIEFANLRAETMLGYARNHLTAEGYTLERLIEGDSNFSHNYSGEVLLRASQNRLIKTHIEYREVRDDSGDLICSVAFIGSPAHAAAPPASQTSAAPGAVNYESCLNNSPIGMAVLGPDNKVTNANQALSSFLGMDKSSVIGKSLRELIAEDDRSSMDEAISFLTANPTHLLERPINVRLSSDGNKSTSIYLSRSEADGISYIAHFIDTTDQKNLEMRFAHSQKMQAVGQLAGGIAHDFNNLLTAMVGFCDLLLLRHPAGDPSFPDLMQIKQNANRAANLVRQLLAFSRRQTLQARAYEITDLLAELSNLVRRLIGENIELKIVHGRDLGMVKVDQGQFEQVIINLAVNARDAMPGGGILTIRTSAAAINRSNPLPRDLIGQPGEDSLPDGEYILVEIADTGTGIPATIVSKIFEPFFSTKEVGSGTGLGLATVYGIVKQTGGNIFVSSKEGEGTRFCLYFPRVHATAQAGKAEPGTEPQERAESGDLTGKETILLVEDENPVRIFSARALRNKGYTILEADSGEAALEIFYKHIDEIDMVVTDVIMPGMNGPTMAEEMSTRKPGLKVIFMSGYAEDAFVKTFGSEREFNFLPKPFTLKQLAGKVKEVLSGE